MKVLIIDDDPIQRELLEGILHKNEYDSISASSVAEGISRLNDEPTISAIILDICMPDADGYAFLRYIKSKWRFRDLPILMCTSRSDNLSVLHCAAFKVEYYIIKPIDAKGLISKLEMVIGKNGPIVLIVDTDPISCQVLRRTLMSQGFNVLISSTCTRASGIMDLREVNVVICKMQMPEMTGLEFMSAIKEKCPGMPVILIIEKGDKTLPQDLLSQGADGCICMPFVNMEINKTLKVLQLNCRSHVKR